MYSNGTFHTSPNAVHTSCVEHDLVKSAITSLGLRPTAKPWSKENNS